MAQFIIESVQVAMASRDKESPKDQAAQVIISLFTIKIVCLKQV
jgi:hypothetical protein